MITAVLGLSACEDVIELETRPGVEQLVVDAFITDEVKTQIIKLTVSQPYFDNSSPVPATGATVLVIREDSTVYEFIDEDNSGEYVWNPKDGVPLLGEAGVQYALYIDYEGEEYVSATRLMPVPKIDSITYEAFTSPINLNDSLPESGFIAQFFAKDIDGEGSTYWIRYRKNGVMNNQPSDFILSYDGSFSPGASTDGLLFIVPIRQAINDFGGGLYQDGDSLEVELYSIPIESYFFLFQVIQESANGGIFAVPSANIPTNIANLNSQSSKKAIGLFSIAKVSKFATVIDEEKAIPED